ncbi:MAG: haloacid dehalogenase, partial [Shinella sp.]|nr:haloacid dehalogenase [Shinella sp.]
PLALAIVNAAGERSIALGDAIDFDSPVGKGVTGTVDGKRLILGSHRIMGEEGVDVSAMTAKAEELRNEGATVIFTAIDGRLAGL